MRPIIPACDAFTPREVLLRRLQAPQLMSVYSHTGVKGAHGTLASCSCQISSELLPIRMALGPRTTVTIADSLTIGQVLPAAAIAPDIPGARRLTSYHCLVRPQYLKGRSQLSLFWATTSCTLQTQSPTSTARTLSPSSHFTTGHHGGPRAPR